MAQALQHFASSITKARNSVDIERERFEKHQLDSITKALSVAECAVKEKHIRIIILGTHNDKSCYYFWQCARQQNLQGHAIICWKFCYVLHKLLRAGHNQCVLESLKYKSFLKDLADLWGHVRDYGKMNKSFLLLLITKLRFHERHPEFPGDLVLDDTKWTEIMNTSEDQLFEMAIDQLDYLEGIVDLKQQVFSSMDMAGRANSMTSSGQCRLAPLLCSILDACQLYDQLVRLLFRLHSQLSADLLDGHRLRFSKLFKELKSFFDISSSLQYFKNLVQIPSLPERPPNFLEFSQLQQHKRPVAELLRSPSVDHDLVNIEGSPTETRSPSEIRSPPEMLNLIDVNTKDDLYSKVANGQHSSVDRSVMDKLQLERDALVAQVTYLKQKGREVVETLTREIEDARKQLDASKQKVTQLEKDKGQLNEQLVENKQAIRTQVQQSDDASRKAEERFKTMRTIYDNLKNQHADLIRKYAEVNRSIGSGLGSSNVMDFEHQSRIEMLTKELHELRTERVTLDSDIVRTRNQLESVNADVDALRMNLNQAERQMHDMQSAITLEENLKKQLMVQLDNLRANIPDFIRHVFKHSCYSSAVLLVDALQKHVIECMNALEGIIAEHPNIVVGLEAADASLNVAVREGLSFIVCWLLDSLCQSNERSILLLQSSQQALDMFDPVAVMHKQNPYNDYFQRLTQSFGPGITYWSRVVLLTTTVSKCHSSILHSIYIRHSETPHIRHSHDASVSVDSHNVLPKPGAEIKANSALKLLQSHVLESGKMLTDSITDMRNKLQQHAVDMDADAWVGKLISEPSVEGYINGNFESDLLKISDSILQSMHQITDVAVLLRDYLLNLLKSVSETKLPEKATPVEDMQTLVEQQMSRMNDAIQKAFARLTSVQERRPVRTVGTGVQMDVSQSILSACQDLFAALLRLIDKSRQLQHEIATDGNRLDVASFYNQQSAWSEGLISAAKAVASACNYLLETVERMSNSSGAIGQNALDELHVASQGIAACTAQLVIASKVKAVPTSTALQSLCQASVAVMDASGQVVAAARVGREQMTKISDEEMVRGLTLTQAKRLRMESKVRLLSLEAELERERAKLATLSKAYYALAGESEGYDADTAQESLRTDQQLYRLGPALSTANGHQLRPQAGASGDSHVAPEVHQGPHAPAVAALQTFPLDDSLHPDSLQDSTA